MGADEKETLGRAEAAKLAGISYNGMRLWERTGRIKGTKIKGKHGLEVRFTESEVRAAISARNEGTGPSAQARKIVDLQHEIALLEGVREARAAQWTAEQALLEQKLELTRKAFELTEKVLASADRQTIAETKVREIEKERLAEKLGRAEEKIESLVAELQRLQVGP